MAYTKDDSLGNYKGRRVEGTITILFSAPLPDGDLRTEIPDEEALLLLEEEKEHLASSNDGSEKIANAKIELFLD